MTDSRERSYYEIALTHTQILTVFVVLLVCVAVAFFAGIWLGRGESPVVQTAEAAEPPAVSVGEEEPLQQLHFFTGAQGTEDSRPADTDPPRQPAGEARTGTTLLEDVTGGAPGAGSTTPDVVAGPRPEPGPPLAAEEAAGPEEGASAPAEGSLVVQVFSSHDRNQARKVVDRLASAGHPAFMSSVEVAGRTMFRVRIGPYADRAQAETVADTVRRTHKLNTWITQAG